jgi:hypothetical protein
VLCSTAAADAPGFAVCGLSEDARFGFDSAELRENSMYSHAFGLSGEIEWMDAHGCQLNGTVIVQDHRCGTNDERVTVFFAVRAAEGISIVDRRLLDAANTFLNPQPLPP